MTSVALQSTQLGAFTTSLSPCRSYTPGGAEVLVELGDLGRDVAPPTTRCDGMSSRVALPALKTASTLPKVSLPSGTNGVRGDARRARHVGVPLGRDVAARERAAGRGHERGLDAAEVEAGLLEHHAHVPARAQVLRRSRSASTARS